jgi:hypothetical protein
MLTARAHRPRSLRHRARSRVGAKRGRLSFPFFFDPGFDAAMASVVPHLGTPFRAEVEARRAAGAAGAAGAGEGAAAGLVQAPRQQRRWDGASPELYSGTYGDYLLAKVAKVFQGLAQSHL